MRRARKLAPEQVRFACRLRAFTDDGEGVQAVVEDRETGERNSVRADWLVGCDGAGSTVRTQSGITMEGPAGLGHFLSVLVEAPLGDTVADRASAVYFLTEPGPGGFMAVDNDRHWIYQYPLKPLQQPPDHDYLAELVRAAAGVPRLAVSVRDTMTWRMDAQLADAYQVSRVLLAGDAAHTTPPTGGHGMNTGIGDADNLAWKLAAVTTGYAGDGLLDSYQAERRPVARQVIDLSLDNARGMRYRIDDELLLTASYRSTAVIAVPDWPDRPPLDPSRRCLSSSGPGDRAPHVRLVGEANVRSTLDLVGPGFTLITQTDDLAWRQRAAAADVPIAVRPLNSGSRHEAEAGSWSTLCGIPAGGAVLIRPDGHIAWTAPGPSPDGELLSVVRRILCRP